MVANWVTFLLLLFGIFVAVFGVVAYLRMFYKQKNGSDSGFETPPPLQKPAAPGEDGQPSAGRRSVRQK